MPTNLLSSIPRVVDVILTAHASVTEEETKSGSIGAHEGRKVSASQVLNVVVIAFL